MLGLLTGLLLALGRPTLRIAAGSGRVEAVGCAHSVTQAAAGHRVAVSLRHLGLSSGGILASARLLGDLGHLGRLPGLRTGRRLWPREQRSTPTRACAGRAVIDSAVLLLEQLEARDLHRIVPVVNRCFVLPVLLVLACSLILLVEAWGVGG